MLRRSCLTLVADFGKGSKKWKGDWTNIQGRALVRNNKKGNFAIHRTTDENRLVTHPAFQHMVPEIDKEYLTKKGIMIEDLRWLDERVIGWICGCGRKYTGRPRDRTKNGFGCRACWAEAPSAVDATIKTIPASEVKDCAVRSELTRYDAAARRLLTTIPCPKCTGPMARTVRVLTGVTAPGQPAVTKQAVCDKCLWTAQVMTAPSAVPPPVAPKRKANVLP